MGQKFKFYDGLARERLSGSKIKLDERLGCKNLHWGLGRKKIKLGDGLTRETWVGKIKLGEGLGWDNYSN